MTKKRSLAVIILSVMLALSAFMFVIMQTKSVNANDTLPEQGEITGTSIKFTEDDTTLSGLRFDYLLDMSVLGNDLSNIKNLGVLMILDSALDGADLTLNNAKVNTEFYKDGEKLKEVNRVTKSTSGEYVRDAEGEYLLLRLYIHSIPLETYKSTDIACVGYVQLKTDEQVKYSDKLATSIEDVAKLAYKNNAHENDAKFEQFLLDCSTMHTLTFDTQGGSAVESVDVINGLSLKEMGVEESSLTTTLSGYEFAGYTLADGATKVDINTPVNADATVYANFKKSQTVNGIHTSLSTAYGLEDISYEPVKVVVGDTTLETSDYSYASSTLSFSKGLVNGYNTVKVYESLYKYVEYTVAIVDNSQSMAFTSFDTDHLMGAWYGANRAQYTSIVSDVMGNTGTFVKLDSASIGATSLKVRPIVSKEMLEEYIGGYIVVDYYLDVDSYSKNIDTICTATVDGGYLNTGSVIKGSVAGAWNKAYISVDELLIGWSYLATDGETTIGYSTGFNADGTIKAEGWAGVLMYFAAVGGDIYIGNLTVEMPSELPTSFTKFDKDYIKGSNYATPLDDNTSILTTTVADRTGTFAKVHVGTTNFNTGLKVKPAVGKLYLEKYYADGYIAFDYYIDIAGDNLNANLIGLAESGGAYGMKQMSARQKWNRAYIPVSILVDNWAYYTADDISYASRWSSNMFAYFGNMGTEYDIYYGGFELVNDIFTGISPAVSQSGLNSVVAGSYGDPRYDFTSIVTGTVGGKTDTYVKIDVDNTDKAYVVNPALKVLPIVSKEYLQENYANGYIVVNYYIDIPNYSKTILFGVTSVVSNNPVGVVSADAVSNTWYTQNIPVADLLTGWDFFNSSTSMSDYTWNHVLMYFGGGPGVGSIYVGGFKLVNSPVEQITATVATATGKASGTTYSTADDTALASIVETYGAENLTAAIGNNIVYGAVDATLAVSVPSGDSVYGVTYTDANGITHLVYSRAIIDVNQTRAFTTLDSSHITSTAYGAASADIVTSFVTATAETPIEGLTSGTLAKVTYKSRTHLTLKVLPTVSKDVITAYKGGYISVKYFVTDTSATPKFDSFSTSNTGTSGFVYNNNNSGRQTGVAGTWAEAKIVINDDLINAWDTYTSKFSSGNWGCGLMYIVDLTSTTEENVIYFTDITVNPASVN